MPPIDAIEQLRSEHDFKALVDALLRLEFGAGVHTFAARGKDGGVDALFEGNIASNLPHGKWVFQYKFTSPLSSDADGRSSALKSFLVKDDAKSEFRKAIALAPAGYVLVTSAALNPAWLAELERRCARILPGVRFLAWDRSALNGRLRGREYLARSHDGILEAAAREYVANPFFAAMHDVLRHLGDRPDLLWPLMPTMVDAAFVDAGELHVILRIRRHPLFRRASQIAFPAAFVGIRALDTRVARLRSACLVEAERVLETYRRGPVEGITNGGPDLVAMNLTTATIYGAWGGQTAEPTQNGASFSVGHKQYHFDGNSQDLIGFIRRTYATELQAGLPISISSAREQVRRTAERLALQLWYPATLGIDCPDDPSRP